MDAASPNRAIPAPVRAQSKCPSTCARTFPSAIVAPALQCLSGSLCAYQFRLTKHIIELVIELPRDGEKSRIRGMQFIGPLSDVWQRSKCWDLVHDTGIFCYDCVEHFVKRVDELIHD